MCHTCIVKLMSLADDGFSIVNEYRIQMSVYTGTKRMSPLTIILIEPFHCFAGFAATISGRSRKIFILLRMLKNQLTIE